MNIDADTLLSTQKENVMNFGGVKFCTSLYLWKYKTNSNNLALDLHIPFIVFLSANIKQYRIFKHPRYSNIFNLPNDVLHPCEISSYS